MQTTFLKRAALVLLTLLLLLDIKAQTNNNPINTTGTLVNEDGHPVAASVIVKGTKNGTTTNEAGVFVLNQINANAVLQVTGVGLSSRELEVNGRTNLGRLVVLSAMASAEEVIVTANTGYQALKPNEINGSVVVVDNKQLNLQAGTNILKRLDGAVSGMQFNIGKTNNNSQNKTGITVRGLGTINGPLDPLIVLDGFIYEGDIENINPNDVENITVLRDAAAASVWGARAGNGVIVITAKKGRLNQKMQVSVASSMIITEKPDLNTMPQMSVADYVELEGFLFGKGYYNSRITGTPFYSLSPAQKVFLNRRSGLISAADSASQIDALKQVDTRAQYRDLVYQQALTQQHSVSLRGGGAKNAYTFSAGYDKTEGNLRERYDKLNLRLLNSFQLHKRIRLSLESFFTGSEAITGQRPYGELKPANGSNLYYNLQQPDGSAAGIDLNYNSAFTDTLLNGRLLDQKFYVLEDYKHNRTINKLQELNANVGLNFMLTKSLTADIRYQYQLQHTVSEKLADKYSYEARELINTFTQRDPVTNTLKYIVPIGGIRTLSNVRLGSQTFRGQLNFIKAFGQHQVNAIAGTESREQRTEGDSYISYGYNADPLRHATIDTRSYIDPITGSSNSVSPRISSTNRIYRFTGMYFNGSWLWKEKYSLSASGRRDGSNIFGANANDRWKPLWSLAGGWRIAKEKFFNSKVIEDLRWKISYGHSGNVDLSKTAVPIAGAISNDIYSGLPYSRINQLNNPNLRWEQVRQLNTGFDFVAFKSRLSGSLEWYSKAGRDLYGPVEWDYTSFGSNSVITQNIADTKGRGVDLILSSKNIIGNKFWWSTAMLLSYNKTITKKYYGPSANSLNSLISGGNRITPVTGHDLYSIVAYQWAGLDEAGNPRGYLEGKPSIDYVAMRNETVTGKNLAFFGSGTPRYFGALTNNIGYNDFTLTFNITAKFGYYAFKPALLYSSIIAGGAGTKDYANRWMKPGDEAFTHVPAFQYPNNANRDFFYTSTEVHVYNASHLRLQYINLAYSPRLAAVKWIKDCQLYVNLANPGILWRHNNDQLDPDYPRGGAPAKAWAFGLRANF